jgi:hypothetical protein
MTLLHLLGVCQRVFEYERGHEGFCFGVSVEEIKLTKGFTALVDDGDFQLLNSVSWCWTKGGYAIGLTNTAKFRKAFPAYISETRMVLRHRLIMQAPAGIEVDHEDRNGLNNQKTNLRFASSGQNKHNSGSRDGTSVFKGVCWDIAAVCWSAQIKKNWKKKALGYFHDGTEAALAYDRAADKLHGEFAQLNFPDNPQRYLPMKGDLRPRSASGFFGVHSTGVRYAAFIDNKTQHLHLGSFETAYDAALYREYHIEKHNLTSRMNF